MGLEEDKLFDFNLDDIIGEGGEDDLLTVDEKVEVKEEKKPVVGEEEKGTPTGTATGAVQKPLNSDEDIENFIEVNLKDNKLKDTSNADEGATGTPTGTDENDGETEGTGNSPDSTSSSSAYNLFANTLHDGGVLPNLNIEEFDGTKEGLINAIVDEITAGIDDFKESLPVEVRDFIDAHKLGVPMDKYLAVRQEETAYSSIDDEALAEDEGMQERIAEMYISRNSDFSQKEIKGIINTWKDSDALLEKAKEAKEKLIIADKKYAKQLQDKAEADRKQAIIDNENYMKKIRKSINDTKEIIPGFTLNKKNRENLYKALTEPAGYINNQPATAVQLKRNEDPIKFETTLNYLLEMGIFDGKWDKILSKAATQSARKLKDDLTKNDTFNTKTKKPKNTQGLAEPDELAASINRMFGGK